MSQRVILDPNFGQCLRVELDALAPVLVEEVEAQREWCDGDDVGVTPAQVVIHRPDRIHQPDCGVRAYLEECTAEDVDISSGPLAELDEDLDVWRIEFELCPFCWPDNPATGANP